MLIAHTTDLSPDDQPAFVHALALAEKSRARLVSIHACAAPRGEEGFPDAERWLEKWSRDPSSVSYEKWVHQCCDEPIDTLLDALAKLKPDLLVCGTHARSGLNRLLAGSVAEGVARNAATLTLLVPIGAKGFVDVESGAVALDTLLVPVGSVWEAAAGVDAALWLARLAGRENPTLVTLHVEDGTPIPLPTVPAGVVVERWTMQGNMDEAIARAARDVDPSAIVMATHGHDGLGDVVLGSHAERMLHRSACPMLWVPFARA